MILMALALFTSASFANVVHYDLEAKRATVNLSGKQDVPFALQLNGQIPAPLLQFTEGDEAEIVVRNSLPDEEISVHWHGLLLPSEMDGVPYVSSPPIRSGETFVFRFPLRQSGTYWYHSHTNVQEQKGLYGGIVIHPKPSTPKAVPYDRDVVAVLSDWSDEDALQILRNLRKDGDYYLYKKGTMRSIIGALRAEGFRTYVANDWTRMGGMDFSDVGYDAFLINGKRDLQLSDAPPGTRLRIRLINASASTYFHVALGAQPLRVLAADGLDVQPVSAKELLLGMAETYDLIYTVPASGNHELRVTAQDGTGFASGWIGSGEKVPAPVKPRPNLYTAMDHSGMDHAAMGAAHGEHTHHASPVIESLTVDDLRSLISTAFPSGAPVHDVKLVLDGDMSRYVWHINGKAIHEERTLEIQEGEVVRFTFENRTMMHHPMHLHGHFFRVLNAGEDRSPLKHTVDVPPHSTRVIEFRANEPGEWMLHCHNLYHLKTGMGRVVKYSSYSAKPEMQHWQKHDPHLHDHRYTYGNFEVASNHAQLFASSSKTWSQYEIRLESRNTSGKNFSVAERWDVEGDLFYRRFVGKYLSFAAGANRFNERFAAMGGVRYRLPLLIEAQALVNQRGNFRLDLEKRFQWTSVVFTDADFVWRPNQGAGHHGSHGKDFEYEISLMYGPRWDWAAGFMLTNQNLGAGIQVQF